MTFFCRNSSTPEWNHQQLERGLGLPNSCYCPCLDFTDGKAHQLLASELLLKAIKENALQNVRSVLDSLMDTAQQIAKSLWCCHLSSLHHLASRVCQRYSKNTNRCPSYSWAGCLVRMGGLSAPAAVTLPWLLTLMIKCVFKNIL